MRAGAMPSGMARPHHASTANAPAARASSAARALACRRVGCVAGGAALGRGVEVTGVVPGSFTTAGVDVVDNWRGAVTLAEEVEVVDNWRGLLQKTAVPYG